MDKVKGKANKEINKKKGTEDLDYIDNMFDKLKDSPLGDKASEGVNWLIEKQQADRAAFEKYQERRQYVEDRYDQEINKLKSRLRKLDE